MTIKFYPSALDGNPIETHVIDEDMPLVDFLSSISKRFDTDSDIARSLTVTVNGKRWPMAKWHDHISADDDVKIVVEPKGTLEAWAIATAIVSVVVSVAAFVFAPSVPKNRSMQGRELGMPDLSANEVRYGDAVPEIAGSPIHYPDYLSPPRRWFVDKRTQKIEMLLCVGRGSFDAQLSNVWIGDTPVTSIPDTVTVNIYQPGQSLALDPAAQHWHNCQEVGVTSVAGAGIALKYNSAKAVDWNAPSFTFFQNSQIVLGGTLLDNVPYPTSWLVGDSLSIPYQDRIVFADDYIQSAMLDSIGVVVGDSIEVGGTNEGVYTVLSITPASGGSAGSPSTITGSISPDVDWSGMPTTLLFMVGGSQRAVVLDRDYVDIDGLIAGINGQLTGFNMSASKTGSPSVLRFTELTPFSGSEIGYHGENGWLMGTPIKVTGTATTFTVPTKYHVAEDFIAMTEVADVGLEGFEYTIASFTPASRISVLPYGKSSWGGFTESRVVIDANVSQTGRTLPDSVYGPFRATPEGVLCDAVELDFFFPRGLIYVKKNGKIKSGTARRMIRWRKIGDSAWNEITQTITDTTRDQIGQTYRLNFPSPGEYEVGVKAIISLADNRLTAEQQWIGMRARVVGYPIVYPDFTVMSVTMLSGDAIATQSENKVKVRFTRILPTVDDPVIEQPTRDLAPFFIHAIESTGKYSRNNIDMQALQDAHDYWVSNGHKFDLAITSQSTLKQVLNQIAKAGFGEAVASRGKITPVLDIKRNGIPKRIYSPQQYVSPLVESISMPRDDDIDGVDCEYVDYTTGKTETIQFRLPGDQGLRATTIKAVGVTEYASAWRMAARHRLMLQYRRVSYSGQTEMHMLTNQYMDYVGMQDGWYEYGQSAYVMASSGNRVRASEPIRDWSPDMVMLFRDSEGNVSEPVSVLSVENEYVARVDSIPIPISLGDSGEEATVVYFGTPERMYYPALITAINPQENGITSFGAIKYDERVYSLDSFMSISVDPHGACNLETYTLIAEVIGGAAPYTWGIESGSLPNGLSVITDGSGQCIISGVPNAPVGIYVADLAVIDSFGNYASASVSISVGNMAAMIPFDGASGSTSFIDKTGKAITAYGGAQISTARSVFGGSSGLFNGTSSYIRFNNESSDFAFGAGDFDASCFIYSAPASGGGDFSDKLIFGGFDTSPHFAVFLTNDNLSLAIWDQVLAVRSTYQLSPNQWNLVRWTRLAGIVRMFIGETLVFESAITRTFGSIGNRNIAGTPVNARYFSGNIDHMRIVKGGGTKISRVPTSPSDYPASTSPLVIYGSLPSAQAGVAYSSSGSIKVSGIYSPYLVGVSSGSLPAGMAVSISGTDVTVSGTPASTGRYSFTIMVNDTMGNIAELPLMFNVI